MSEPWRVGQCCHCQRPLDPSAVVRRHAAFCNQFCSKHAEQVRYVRRAIRDGRLEDPMTLMVMVHNNLAFLAYDIAYVRPRLSEEVRRDVLQSNDGMCVVCNTEPATEVDHICGGSQERQNLRGLCRICHELKPRGAIPDDLTRDSAGAVDDSETSDRILTMWKTTLSESVMYDEEAPDPAWCALLEAARGEPDNRFAQLTLAILDPQTPMPAHGPDWQTSWGSYARRTRAWAAAIR